jgi:hypothetical protein
MARRMVDFPLPERADDDEESRPGTRRRLASKAPMSSPSPSRPRPCSCPPGASRAPAWARPSRKPPSSSLTRMIGSWPLILSGFRSLSPSIACYTGLRGLAPTPLPDIRTKCLQPTLAPGWHLYDKRFPEPLQLQGHRKPGLSIRFGRYLLHVWASAWPFVLHCTDARTGGIVDRLAGVSDASRRPSRSSRPCWAGRRCSPSSRRPRRY